MRPFVDAISSRWEEPAIPIEEDDDGIGLLTPIREFKRGLWSSLTTGNVQTLGGAAEAFEVLGGREPESGMGRKVQQWIGDPSRQTEAPFAWEDADGPWGVASYLAGLTGSGIGSMAAPIAAGAAGAAVGSAAGTVTLPIAGTVAGGTVGAVAGAFSVGTLLNVGETYLQLRDEGVDPKQAAQWAMPAGAGIGVIDTLGLSRLLGATVLKEVKQKAITAFVVEGAKGYARGATEEGITEMAQAALREGLAATLTGNLDLQRRALSTLEEGLAGGLGGGAIGGVGRGVRAAAGARRPTLTERQPVPDRSDLLDGGPMDEMVLKGNEVVSTILDGDERSAAKLGEQGLPPIGSDVMYRTETGDQPGRVTGFIPADDSGPDSIVIEDVDELQTVIPLPLQEGESLSLTEDAERQRGADEFVAQVGEVAGDADGQDILTAMLGETGASSLGAVPADQQKQFASDLKKRIDDTRKAAVDQQVQGRRRHSVRRGCDRRPRRVPRGQVRCCRDGGAREDGVAGRSACARGAAEAVPAASQEVVRPGDAGGSGGGEARACGAAGSRADHHTVGAGGNASYPCLCRS